MTAVGWRRLALRVAIGATGATLLVLIGPLVSLRFHPLLAIAVGAVIGALAWAFSEFRGPQQGPVWEQPHWDQRSAFLQADVRTRRLAHDLAHARPGSDFEARRVSTLFAELAARRLVTTGRVTAGDPLAHAADHLSPALLSYLRSATAERAQTLTRKALHRHLKEIDSL